MEDTQIKVKGALFQLSMRRFLFLLALLALPVAESRAGEAIRIFRSSVPGAITVDARSASVAAVGRAISLHLDRPVVSRAAERRVSVTLRNMPPLGALEEFALQYGLALEVRRDAYILSDRAEKTLTLDVKDAEAADILRSVQRQCGIRNLMIDPDVRGSGTFLFRDVPCGVAIDTILQSLGLAGEVEMNSILHVEARP
jgi:hypothetical protein